MLDPENISKRVFVFAVTAAAIGPRMPFDRAFAVGGELSKGFRYLLVTVAVFNTIRTSVLHLVGDNIALALFALECLMTSFLSLLTPYLLRVFMADRMNYPGRNSPGKGLLAWVYAIVSLSLLGVGLRAFTGTDDPWIFKKIADALTFVPVFQTIRLHNLIATAESRYPGRGHVLSQVLLIVEVYCLFVHSADIVLRILKLTNIVDLLDSSFHAAMYTTSNHYAVFTRILCHSILLNAIDELSVFQHSANTASTEEDNHGTVASSGMHLACATSEAEVIDQESAVPLVRV